MLIAVPGMCVSCSRCRPTVGAVLVLGKRFRPVEVQVKLDSLRPQLRKHRFIGQLVG